MSEWSKLENRIHDGPQSNFRFKHDIDALRWDWLDIQSKIVDDGFERILKADENNKRDGDKKYQLQSRKLWAQSLTGFNLLSSSIDNLAFTLQPDCANPAILGVIALGYKPPIVERAISSAEHLFEEQISNDITESKKDLKTLQDDFKKFTDTRPR